MLVGGLIVRLLLAHRYFLNPDEALHYVLATQSSVGLAYKAALTNAHPPLLILVLYYWRVLGYSELWLRMPSVLAGSACCWIVYQWLKQVTDQASAFIGLLLLSFAPSLIGLSAEIRQYALLLFFMAGCLYFSERAIQRNSPVQMIWFSLSLYGALLTHYSSLIFACTMGVYLLVRLWPVEKRLGLFAVWAAGQAGALGLSLYFLITHVTRLKSSGMAQGIADTWLRKSIFHPGERNVGIFILSQTVRVFTFLFSHGVVGTLALLVFLAGLTLLLRKNTPHNIEGPTGRELALLISLPFAVNCATALGGQYPYGATRHNVFLAPFAVTGIAVGLAAWLRTRGPAWTKYLVIVAALALCNLFPSPPPMIRERNHSRSLMKAAVATLRQSAPPGSILFSDYESGLLLGYYVCGHEIVKLVYPSFFAKADCGPYTAITARPQEWKLYGQDMPDELANLQKAFGLASGSKIWLFDAGWITDSGPALKRELQNFDCSKPQNFGENIFLCQVTIGEEAKTKAAQPVLR